MSLLTAIFSAISGFFAWLTGRNATANRPDMVRAAKAQNVQTAEDAGNREDADAIQAANLKAHALALEKIRREDAA